jgi:hypothetical protein
MYTHHPCIASPAPWNVVAVVMAFLVDNRALKALAGDFCAFFLAPLRISRVYLKKYGSWAGTYIKIYCFKL